MSDIYELLDGTAIVGRRVPLYTKKCGIYFLIMGDRIVYIGRAIDIDRRLLTHEKRGFDAWSWVPCPRRDQVRLERRYLDKFLPPLNRDVYTEVSRRAASTLVENLTTLEPRIRKGRLTPKGCYWRGDTLWARHKLNRIERRRSLGTADAGEAVRLRDAWVDAIRNHAQSGAQSTLRQEN